MNFRREKYYRISPLNILKIILNFRAFIFFTNIYSNRFPNSYFANVNSDGCVFLKATKMKNFLFNMLSLNIVAILCPEIHYTDHKSLQKSKINENTLVCWDIAEAS